jgi:hypothetical protein
MKHKLVINILEYCYYSNLCKNTILKNNLKRAKKSINIIAADKKERTKKYMKTFPQIYLLNDENDDSIVLGGNSEFEDYMIVYKSLVKYSSKKNVTYKKLIMSLAELWNKEKNTINKSNNEELNKLATSIIDFGSNNEYKLSYHETIIFLLKLN